MNVFSSRKSILLGSFLWGVILLVFIITGGFINLAMTLTWIFTFSFVAVIWFGIRYQIGEELLDIKVGPIRVIRIKIKEISYLERSFNPISSPAASLKRLNIKFKGGEILISPKHEDQFLQKLKSINPEINIDVSSKLENDSLLTRFVYSIL
ncbi:PH domain-containing protein [Ekhidna sp.]|uniref:PH domain-containing protein n=1 Tax=Ekhidna sp. TaxID=2608089 RepID=UPI003BAC18FF